jgi:hypothetical protein
MMDTRVSWRPEFCTRRTGILVGYADNGNALVRWRNRIEEVKPGQLTTEVG